jgi:Asp-tRNA(Asn)/Glu-tRNA(Gln) amidotransferase A subunit family amidase
MPDAAKMPNSANAPTRRQVMRAAAVALGAGAVPLAERATAADVTYTPGRSTTAPAESPAGAGAGAAGAGDAGAVTPADAATAANRVGGHAYTDAECAMMAPGVSARRDRLKALRAAPVDVAVAPAVQFDPRLPGVAYPSGPSVLRPAERDEPAYDGDPRSLAFASVADLSRLVHARKITSVELTKMYLERLERIGPKLLCVVTLTRELALEQAAQADRDLRRGRDRGPLHGIPYGAKDLLATKGVPTTWGVKPLANQVFDYDATAVAKLADAGAVLVAKLSLGELAMGDVWFGGKTRSPWDVTSGSSGSSAGPGAATAAGLVGFAVGSETLGSIVSPSVVNGVTGLRPTYGRVSRHGAMSLAFTMDKLGPMCRGVEDCALVLAAMHGPDGKDASAVAGVPFNWDPAAVDPRWLRVGYDAEAWETIRKGKDGPRKAALLAALEAVRGIAGELKPVRLPPAERFTGLASVTIACESAASFAEMVDDGRIRQLVQQDPGSWPNGFRSGSLIPAADYLRAMRLRTVLQQEMAAALADVDLYVTVPNLGPTLSYTNLTGHPSLVTRCGLAGGKPVSVEFVGQLYREDAVLRVGLAYEQATKWHTQWPDTGRL